MPFRKVRQDVKLAAINLYEREHLSLGQILDCVGFSERTFWRILKLWKESGDVVRHTYGIRGRPRIFHFEDLHYLLRLVHHRPDWFLDEMLDLLDDNRLVAVHFSTIYQNEMRSGVPTSSGAWHNMSQRSLGSWMRHLDAALRLQRPRYHIT